MNAAIGNLRNAMNHSADALEMLAYNDGFEAAINLLDEFSDAKHNLGDTGSAEALRAAAKELRGENAN